MGGGFGFLGFFLGGGEFYFSRFYDKVAVRFPCHLSFLFTGKILEKK